jgi:hypothetical protein
VKHRKCDTAKYRRRKKKEKANRRTRLETATPAQQEDMIKQAEAPKTPGRPICPLCKQAITVDDAVHRNVDEITYMRQRVQVHKTCPAEKGQ